MRAELARHVDLEFAAGVRNFFVEPVDPWGVRSADLRKIEQMVYREVRLWPPEELNEFCDKLWQSRKLEEGVLVCHVYRRFARRCKEAEWTLFESWIDRYVSNWANCDGIASWLLAACIGNTPALRSKLPAWTQSSSRWKRRASAVALLQEAKAGRGTETIFHIADLLSDDLDDMVQKGVGWLLKEAYPKQPSAVLQYLHAWPGARLVVRLGAEKMTAAHRAEFGFGQRKLSRSSEPKL